MNGLFRGLFMLVLLTWGGVLSSVPASARGWDARVQCIEDAIHQTVAEVSSDFLTAEDRRKITNALNPHPSQASEAVRKVFELVLEARLRQIPRDQAAEVRKILAQVLISQNPSFLHARYLERAGRIEMNVPSPYIGTILELWALIHELEHAVQNQRTRARTSSLKRWLNSVISSTEALVRQRYAEEEGAMRLEWAFLSLLPISEKNALRERVVNDRSLTPSQQSFMAGILELSGMNPTEYLATQRSWKRYSWEITRSTVEDWRTAWTFAVMNRTARQAGAAAIILIYLCSRAEPTATPTESSVFHRTCQGMRDRLSARGLWPDSKR